MIKQLPKLGTAVLGSYFSGPTDFRLLFCGLALLKRMYMIPDFASFCSISSGTLLNAIKPVTLVDTTCLTVCVNGYESSEK